MKLKNILVLLSFCLIFLIIAAFATTAKSAEFHVATNGNDSNPGTKKLPFLTIQHAADLAQPGDIITVHAGIYRECINPPRGGTSNNKRITYQAAPNEKVIVTGSEIVKSWVHFKNDTWQAMIPNSFFGKFNPYSDIIRGDWFLPQNRTHHTGSVYLNGDWLQEAARLDDMLKPIGDKPLWFAVVSSDTTTISAQFEGINPNENNVEINVRQTVFTPEKPGINYITVRGFDMRNAATPWAPPTAGQIGIISAYWCKGWIIENNEISYSKCSGIVLGKYSDEWDNYKQAAEQTPEAFVATYTRALTNGWNKETVGSHLVRNNHVHHCEQAGIVGSLGCAFSTITDNEVHDIHVQRLFSGWEQAGIKFHGACDVTINRNHVYDCGCNGIWLDWMSQGAQIIGNLLHNNMQPNTNDYGDFSIEMQHGPILIANNLMLTKRIAFGMNSQGIAYAHNLVGGAVVSYNNDRRITPINIAHSTAISGMYPASKGASGDHRFYNNLYLAPCSMHPFDKAALPCFYDGNVFTKGALASKFDVTALSKQDFDADMKLEKKSDGWYLTLNMDKQWRQEAKRKLVTTNLLGKTKVSGDPFENADGSPLFIDTDYFGNKRDKNNPAPGPFEKIQDGQQSIKVWPIKKSLKN
jgi:alpha-L-arabinofuranosidase